MQKDASGLWFCLQCDFNSSRRGNVQSHVEAKHVISEGVSCGECGTICPTRKALSMHVYRNHRVVWIKMAKCTFYIDECRTGWIDWALPWSESRWVVAVPLLPVQLASQTSCEEPLRGEAHKQRWSCMSQLWSDLPHKESSGYAHVTETQTVELNPEPMYICNFFNPSLFHSYFRLGWTDLAKHAEGWYWSVAVSYVQFHLS